MSPMVGDLLSVVIRGENSQRILLMSNHRQWTSPTSATYENQALCLRLCTSKVPLLMLTLASQVKTRRYIYRTSTQMDLQLLSLFPRYYSAKKSVNNHKINHGANTLWR